MLSKLCGIVHNFSQRSTGACSVKDLFHRGAQRSATGYHCCLRPSDFLTHPSECLTLCVNILDLAPCAMSCSILLQKLLRLSNISYAKLPHIIVLCPDFVLVIFIWSTLFYWLIFCSYLFLFLSLILFISAVCFYSRKGATVISHTGINKAFLILIIFDVNLHWGIWTGWILC